MPPICVSRHRARHLLMILGLLTGVCVALPGDECQAQAIGRLYASKPPPGYSYVRVVPSNASSAVSRIQMNAQSIDVTENAAATAYRAVPGNEPLRLSVAGARVDGEISPRPDSYLTVAITKDGAEWRARSIDEGQGAADGLKARLRFFNLVPDCAAVLKIKDGPVVFANASFATMLSRSINPVSARLDGSCGENHGSLDLPELHAGDSYSVFLRADAGKIILSGQLDETEAYRER